MSNFFIAFTSSFGSQSTFYNNLINFICFDISGLSLIDIEFFNIFINLDEKSKRNKRVYLKDLKFKD